MEDDYTTFKVGDTVERISGYHNGMKVGMQGIITHIKALDCCIQGYGDSEADGAHDIRKFKLVKRGDGLVINNYSIF